MKDSVSEIEIGLPYRDKMEEAGQVFTDGSADSVEGMEEQRKKGSCFGAYIRIVGNKVFCLPRQWCYLIVSLILAYYAGAAIPFAKALGLSLTEYILFVLTDHYYLIYAWFFFLLYWMMHAVPKMSQQEWIRYGSYKMKCNVDNLTVGIQLTLMIIGNLLLVLFIGLVGLGPSDGFRIAGMMGDEIGNLQVLAGYAQVFPNPVTAIVCVVLYWDLGCCFLYSMLYYGHHLGGRKMMIGEMVVCMVSTIAGFMTDVDESALNVFFFNNDYILHHALLLVGSEAACVNIAVMIIAWIGIRGIALWKKGIPT
ncbi:MAG: hypothetical protein K2K70_02870 [Lachnospiraceae bacterium]|nr:hypothetical protein [Lachnospiraceae bacterium]